MSLKKPQASRSLKLQASSVKKPQVAASMKLEKLAACGSKNNYLR